jgi:hypothetical protein
MGKRGSRTQSGVRAAPVYRAFQSADEIEAWGDYAWGEWLKGLDRKEARALTAYTRNEYEFVNEMLRREMFTSMDPDIYVDPTFRETAQLLDQALARGRVPENVTVYRGMRIPRVYDMIRDGTLPIGQRMFDRAYISTSLNRKLAKGFTNSSVPDLAHGSNRILVTIDVPAGSAGGYAQKLSRGSAEPEYELLLPRECRFVVKGYEMIEDEDWPGSPPIAHLRLEVVRESTLAEKSSLYPPGWSGDIEDGGWG